MILIEFVVGMRISNLFYLLKLFSRQYKEKALYCRSKDESSIHDIMKEAFGFCPISWLIASKNPRSLRVAGVFYAIIMSGSWKP